MSECESNAAGHEKTRGYSPERARRDRRLGWLNIYVITVIGMVTFGGRFFFKMIAEGDSSTWWALGASMHFAAFITTLFWGVALLRGGSDQLPGWPTRIILSAAIAVVVTATLMTAFWIIAENAGHPLRL